MTSYPENWLDGRDLLSGNVEAKQRRLNLTVDALSSQTGRSENENGFTRSPDRTRKKYRPAGSVVGTPT